MQHFQIVHGLLQYVDVGLERGVHRFLPGIDVCQFWAMSGLYDGVPDLYDQHLFCLCEQQLPL
jgi:hypothetical protein